jgi:hypothetical protein
MNSIASSIILELQKQNDTLQIELKEIKEIFNKIIIQIYFVLILFYILVQSYVCRCTHRFRGFI